MVKGDANWSPLKDWLDAYTASKSDILISKREAMGNSFVAGIVGSLKDIKDTFLVEMAQEYKAIDKVRHSKIPSLITAKIGELKEVAEFVDKDKKFAKLVKDKYALLGDLQTYGLKVAEVTIYGNAKFDG